MTTRRVVESLAPRGIYDVSDIVDRLQAVMLWEPPGADSLAGWCGEQGRKTPAYPIRFFLFFLSNNQVFYVNWQLQ